MSLSTVGHTLSNWTHKNTTVMEWQLQSNGNWLNTNANRCQNDTCKYMDINVWHATNEFVTSIPVTVQRYSIWL